MSVDELLEYTDCEREKWQEWLQKQGDQVLETSAGPNCDERFKAVGKLIRHVFSAKIRYVDRLTDRPLSETGSLPGDNTKNIVCLWNRESQGIKGICGNPSLRGWEVMKEFDFFGNRLRATPRKVVVHVVMYGIRHWAQIATLFRLSGLRDKFHDFLFSPVRGGELIREPDKVPR